MAFPEVKKLLNPEVGDTVVLKSGGPDMTVSVVYLDNLVTEVWFDDNGHLCSSEFAALCLNKIYI